MPFVKKFYLPRIQGVVDAAYRRKVVASMGDPNHMHRA